ncbi:MerR-like DNA binding protein [Kineococcus xinjiangensis]|uniref:MerR-like DNA binding protein n=1 Tax=Kineococcus xinjiangensis TaxID=512762 RepID=A0A2S6IW44_9ACTN|nr:MerR family transcriptional regulator [Kineococcus xinjiangensis]PPK98568.1 MerR-like DNA binding protein [Kineococcus xinjiangensis]
MRISELSRTSGVPIATIKYYLREGLLQAGQATGATRSEYGEPHLRRLRLIRALVDVGGLPLAKVREVLACVDDPPASLHCALGTAHDALGAAPPDARGADLAEAVVAGAGWRVDRASPAFAQLGAALAALVDAGFPAGPAALERYVRAAVDLATAEVADVPRTDTAAAVQFVVLGTILYEPVLLALRRLAQQHASATTLG